MSNNNIIIVVRPLFQSQFDGTVVAFFGSFIVIVGHAPLPLLLLLLVVALLLQFCWREGFFDGFNAS